MNAPRRDSMKFRREAERVGRWLNYLNRTAPKYRAARVSEMAAAPLMSVVDRYGKEPITTRWFAYMLVTQALQTHTNWGNE